MRRSLLILLAVLISSAAIVGLSSAVAKRLCVQHFASPSDDLVWLRREFRLNDAEMQRVRQLHEGYLPKCRGFCERIDARKRELQATLASGANAPGATEQKLIEIGTIRAQCQAAMLQHFRDVSQVMPAEQGRRYLSEMQRLTLGFHEQIEKAMSADPSAHHGNR
jgi:hypothetical protein